MLPFLAIALGVALPPSDWSFQDDLTRDDRLMVTFQTLELGVLPPRPLHADDKPPAEALFGDVRIGSGRSSRRATVWHRETNTLWLDADGDGRFAGTERHKLGKNPLEVRVTFAVGDTVVDRTLIVKRRGDEIAHAVRGYRAGTIALGGKSFAALLTDGDADGCFDSATGDRVWIDLDGDGKFDPLTEHFPLGSALTHAKTSYLIRPDAMGTKIAVRERPSEAGTVWLTVTRVPRSEVVELTAQLVSEWGELVTVPAAAKAHRLPAGRYRIEGVRLKVKDGDGRVWSYQFHGTRETVINIAKDKETVFDVTEGLRIAVELATDSDGAKPGQRVRVRPDVVTKGGLSMTDCEVAEVGGAYGQPVRAAIRLAGPGSAPVDRVEAGFL
jgi:hypothetical protein